MCTPSVSEISTLVSVSPEAEKVCRLAECFDLIDAQIGVLNKRSQDLQEYYIKELVNISEEHKKFLQQRSMIEEAVMELTSKSLRSSGYSFNLNS